MRYSDRIELLLKAAVEDGYPGNHEMEGLFRAAAEEGIPFARIGSEMRRRERLYRRTTHSNETVVGRLWTLWGWVALTALADAGLMTLVPHSEMEFGHLLLTATLGWQGAFAFAVMWLVLAVVLVRFAGFRRLSAAHLFSDFGGRVNDRGMKPLWMYSRRPYTRVLWLVGLTSLPLLLTILLFLLGGLLLNVLGWAHGLLRLTAGMVAFLYAHWPWLVALVLGPLVVFLLMAGGGMLLVAVLRLWERQVETRYNLKHKCPHTDCGNSSHFLYLAPPATPDGRSLPLVTRVHPVALRPGRYGLLHHRYPGTGEMLPTMIQNGKDKLTRLCPKCGRLTNEDEQDTAGTQVHVGIAGMRSSGKTFLLYGALHRLQERTGGRLRQVDVDGNDIELVWQRMSGGDDYQTPDRDSYRAVQAILTVENRPWPYHLNFYDVAGEKFDAARLTDHHALTAYRNLQALLFVVDPSTLSTRQLDCSPEFRQWQQEVNADGERLDVRSAFSVLVDVLQGMGRQHGDKMRGLPLMVVCTKSDLGYLTLDGVHDYPSSGQVRELLCRHLGLYGLVAQAESLFPQVSYHAVSVYNPADLDALTAEALRLAGVEEMELSGNAIAHDL